VEEVALQSKKTGADADLLRTSWIIVSVVQQEKISAADRNIRNSKLGFIIWPPPPITALRCKALHFKRKLFHYLCHNLYMMRPEIVRLNLLQPLLYNAEPELTPWEAKNDGEKLFCFELEPLLAREFQPDKEKFPGTLVFAGSSTSETQAKAVQDGLIAELPKGNYLFTQVREALSRSEIIDLAIEVQNEGLWQRLDLGFRYYLRFLFEDGSLVTQIFRSFQLVTI
jgi:hypothetical protein